MKGSDLEVVRVSPARHGKGLFAVREFRTGEVVGELTGRIVQQSDYESDYCIEIDSQTSLEPYEPFRFMNHSCRPNCELACWEEGSTEIWVEAIRNIDPEEELTIDYAWPAISAIACGCGSPNCRGWIVAVDQLDDVVYTHNEGFRRNGSWKRLLLTIFIEKTRSNSRNYGCEVWADEADHGTIPLAISLDRKYSGSVTSVIGDLG